MSMVIKSNLSGLNANRQLGLNNAQMGKALERIATGWKINSAADDASGLAISEKLLAQLRGLSTASSNAQDSISLVQTAEGAMGSIHDMLGRMTELAGRASNGTLSDQDRSMLQSEMDSLLSEIDRVAQSTNFNGQKLLDGSIADGLQMQVGDTADSQNKVSVSIGNLGTTGLGISGFDISTQDGALAALEKLRATDGAINQVSSARGELGAVQNRLEHTINNLDTTYENLMAANSRIRDADIAKEMMAFTQTQVLRSVSTAMLAHSNMQAQGVLQLLR